MDPFDLGGHFLCSAHYLAHASNAAYEELPQDYGQWTKLNLASVQLFASADFTTRGFVASNEEAVVVAFRGTDDVADWLTNLDAIQTGAFKKVYGGKVHEGFARALNSVWHKVVNRIELLRTKKQRIWVTGHSLGGALATLAGRRLGKAMKPAGIFTFGQPRVGDPQFAKKFKLTMHRFVNDRDLAPRVPPRGIFIRYRHVGIEQFLRRDGQLEQGEGDTSLLENLFLTRIVNEMGDRALTEAELDGLVRGGLEDHKITNYIKKIRQNIGD